MVKNSTGLEQAGTGSRKGKGEERQVEGDVEYYQLA